MPGDAKHTRHVNVARGPAPGAAPAAPAKSKSEPTFPRRFGSYEILAPLGRGGMGDVSLARRRGPASIDQLCVLKQVRLDATDRADYARRFLDEVRVMAQLNHTHVCHVIEVGEHDGTLFLALEHIKGLTLDQMLLSQPGPLPTALALFLLTEVLEGLDYAHRHKHPLTGVPLPVVHRDVSPLNVMVTFEGEVKLIDFGLATSDLKAEHTETDFVMGKIAYMSPEQARGDPVDGRTDQYAAAIMGTELLLHERYYGTRPQHVVWGLCGAGTFRPERFGEIPTPLRLVLDRALSADREKRFPDCRTFKAALLESGADVAAPRDLPAALRDHLEKTCAPARESAAKLVRDAVSLTLDEAPARPPPDPAPVSEARTLATAESENTLALVREMGASKGKRAAAIALAAGLLSLGVAVALWPRDGATDPEPDGPEQAAVEAAPEAVAPATTVQLRFRSEPPGAFVFPAEGGPVLGVAPFSVEVEGGGEPRTYRAMLSGFQPSVLSVTPDADQEVLIQLAPVSSPSPSTEPAAPRARPPRPARKGEPPAAARKRPKAPPKQQPLDKDRVVDPY